MLDSYSTVGRRDARWDKPATEFISALLPWALSDRHISASPPAEFEVAAESLLTLGCDDPVVLGLAGMLKHSLASDSTEGHDLLKLALVRFQETRHPRAVARWFAGEYEASGHGRRDAEKIREEADRLSLEWLALSLRDGSYLNEAQVLAQHYVVQDSGAGFFQRKVEECGRIFDEGRITLSPWVKALFAGRVHYIKTWKARGPQADIQLPQRDLDAFHAGMEKARAAYTASLTANPSRPEAAAQMIRVSSFNPGPAGDSPRLWFERTLSIQFDYPDAFHSFALFSLPRWGGSHRLILELGRECAATKRFETLVPLHLLHALVLVDGDLEFDGRILRDSGWRAALDNVLSAYETEQKSKRPFFRSLRALVAWKSRDSRTAYRILQELDFRLEPEAVGCFPDLEILTVTAAIASGGGAEAFELKDAEDAWRSGERAAARTRLRGLVAAFSERASGARALLASQNLSERLEDGSWNRFRPIATIDGRLPGWNAYAGEWRVGGDGTLIGRASEKGLILTCDANVGPDFDVRGELEIDSPTGMAGIVFGGRDFRQDAWLSVRIQRNLGETGRVVIGAEFGGQTSIPAIVRERNTFVVRSWQGRITVHLNGTIVVADASAVANAQRDPEGRVGFVAPAVPGRAVPGAHAEVRFRRLEIRRLRNL